MFEKNQIFFEKYGISSFSHKAMNTTINLFIPLEDKIYAEQAASEAFREIDILEDMLSRFRPNSDVSKINNLRPGEYTVVSEDTQNCLLRSMEMYDMTGGIFDISIGNAIDFFKEGKNAKYKSLKSCMESLVIDKTNFTVIVDNKINIDLGGIGKGYAAEVINELLKDWEIDNYLISLGNSTLKTGISEDKNFAWPLSISNPATGTVIREIQLKNGCLSSSGKVKGNHIIDPVSIEPPKNQRMASWTYSEDAAVSDALSTAFMIMEEKKIVEICNKLNISCALLISDGETEAIKKFGGFF